ncbi:hypothetical protein ABH995_000877 [Bradyrhizobium yuanmingense]
MLAVELANRESRSSWMKFLEGLKARGLHGVEFVVSDDHPGLKKAAPEVLDRRVLAALLRGVVEEVVHGSARCSDRRPSHQPGTPRDADSDAPREAIKHKRSATRAAASRLRLMAAAVR